MKSTLQITPTQARKLAVSSQRLSGPQTPTSEMLGLVRQLGCLQLDPISAVARSHLLVLWSRLGPYDPTQIEDLLYRDKALFEYWAHAASIVLTEDYPIHRKMMRDYRAKTDGWSERVNSWIGENAQLYTHIRGELEENGPLPSRYFEDQSARDWESSGWTGGRNVGRMLNFMWTRGEIMVSGRAGIQKLWDLSERCLPEWTPRDELSSKEVVRRSALKSLGALGVARQKEIVAHYTRGRYPGIAGVLKELEAEGLIERVEICDSEGNWPGPYYMRTQDAEQLPHIEKTWEPRTVLLSPFDNLICDRARTEKLFNFYFRIEIYVPEALRQYGYYVLPILHGERLIGRINPTMDRKNKHLRINNVYAENGAPMDKTTAREIKTSIERLATFLGAKEITYGESVPEGWNSTLR